MRDQHKSTCLLDIDLPEWWTICDTFVFVLVGIPFLLFLLLLLLGFLFG